MNDDEGPPAGPPPSWELVDSDATWVELHPRPLWARRLAEHPDALWLVADRDGLIVPAWLLDGRPRTIDKLETVTITWSTIERFRVRADPRGPDVYDITCVAESGATTQWRVRRGEIWNEVAILDHARRIGRVTIELEDSIRSG